MSSKLHVHEHTQAQTIKLQPLESSRVPPLPAIKPDQNLELSVGKPQPRIGSLRLSLPVEINLEPMPSLMASHLVFKELLPELKPQLLPNLQEVLRLEVG